MEKIIEKIEREKDTIRKIKFKDQYQMTAIPDVIKACTHLEELDISFTEITEIPAYITAFRQLKALRLYRM